MRVLTGSAWQRRVLVAALVAAVGGCLAALWAFGPGRLTVRRWLHPITREHIAGRGEPVVIIGDSFTQGVGADQSYAEILSKRQGWDATIVAEFSAGYAFPGLQGDRGPQLVAMAAPDRSPSMVLVALGYNDCRGFPADDIRRNATVTIRAAERRWPTAQIVMVGPIASGSPAPPDFRRVDRILHGVATATSSRYVRAVDWLSDDAWISQDHIHPDQAGYQREASMLARALG